MQQTLVLLKPDCVQPARRGHSPPIRAKGCDFGMEARRAVADLAEQHYAVHKGKPFYDSLLAFLTSGPTIAIVLEGREAVAVVRQLMGTTDGAKSPPGTIAAIRPERPKQPDPRQRFTGQCGRGDCPMVPAENGDVRELRRQLGWVV